MTRIILLSLLTLLAGGTGAPGRSAPQSGDPGKPTARMCILKDLGAPDPTNRYRTLDPIWSLAIGQVSVGPLEGDLYSTSPSGGFYGKGVAFRVSRQGLLTVLHPFRHALDGGGPRSGLILGHDGNYWGTTYEGGKLGVGTIFRVSPNGGEPDVRIHLRNGNMLNIRRPCEDQRCPYTGRQRADAAGSYPVAPPVHDGRGNYYGVTSYSNNQQAGTLYRLSHPYDSTGFRTLCIFDRRMLADSVMRPFVCADQGRYPAGLILSRDGRTLYGVLIGESGHLYRAPANPNAELVKAEILHAFTLESGARPYNLMQASNDLIYGTTYNGGDLGGGVVYSFDPSSRDYRAMTSFRQNGFIAGINPVAGLSEKDGMLYGATRYGGRHGRGMLYRIPLEGDSMSLEVLHDFNFYGTGRSPLSAPVPHPDGYFYGITSEGGTHNGGVVYRLSNVNLARDTMRDVQMTAGTTPRNADGITPVTDDMVEVRTGVQAWQGAWDSSKVLRDGISILTRCRTPHFVQFVQRQILDADGVPLSAHVYSTTGEYDLTTPANQGDWHTDARGKPNAFYEEGPGAGRWSYMSGQITALKMYDSPQFSEPLYRQTNQDAPNSQTWLFRARTFVICNCHVTREVRWTIEVKYRKRSYKDVQILKADNSAYRFINEQAERDGFEKIPPP
jgi:uncharacterized repeat protein (TIGR03803 family)